MDENGTEEAKAIEDEFNILLGKWNKEHSNSGYDPVPDLSRISTLIEVQTREFQKMDPDPFDDRHPSAIMPNCLLGNLINSLSKNDDFLMALIQEYLKVVNLSPSNLKLTTATARLLLAVMPGMDVTIMNQSHNSVIDLLYKWAEKADEPLNIYSVGILAQVLENQDINIKYTNLSLKLTDKLLKDISKMIFPKLNGDTKEHKSERKRKASSPEDKAKKVLKSEKVLIRRTSDLDMTNEPSLPEIYDNDISNSSWNEQMPFVIGSQFDLAPPLSDSIKQSFILDFLKSVGEYQDYLPVFIENKVLHIVKYFVMTNRSDGMLTFKALHFLGTLLCHNKIANEFINRCHGIDQLLSVQRPSLGSTGVSMCLYYLSYKTEAMESVCQLHKSKHHLVKYAVWLLECSHESGKCHAALFFSFSFAFRVILNLFDHFGGLRCLLNMISMFAIQNADNTEEEVNSQTSRQTIKVVCTTLKKYCEAHLLLKAVSLQSNIMTGDLNEQKLHETPADKAMEMNQEQIQSCLEFVRIFEYKYTNANDSSVVTPWPTMNNFLKHKGVKLLLYIISIAVNWRSDLTGRLETIKSALSALCVITLLKKAQLQLLKLIEPTTESNDENNKAPMTGVSLLLSIAEGNHSISTAQSDLQKLALSIILNCVYMPNVEYIDPKMNVSSSGDKSFSEDCKHKMWTSIRQNNGIRILLSLLINKQKENVYSVSIPACKSLYGLSYHQSVQQILPKLPLFNEIQLQHFMTRDTVVQGKQKEHAIYCKEIENLLQRITGKPASLEFYHASYKKSNVVSQTQIRFDNKELLGLMHGHLVWSGLSATANLLKKEAGLSTKALANMFQIPQNAVNLPESSNNKTQSEEHTPPSNKICFSRGSQAAGATPLTHSVQSVPHTPSTPSSSSLKKLLRSRIKNHVSNRFKISQTGKVTIKPKTNQTKTDGKALPSLNTIVEQYLRHQHVSCKNPVLTVPDFSLFKDHYCPVRRWQNRAPTNLAVRSLYRQIVPNGGIGGYRCDRQYVFSRFRSSYTVKVPDERKINYTCAAFSANNDQLIIGDDKGGVTLHSLYSVHDNIFEGVGNVEISYLQPNSYNDTLLVISENLWDSHCSLYSTTNQFELKYTLNDVSHVEFSKLLQDKIIGSKLHKATVFDANVGKKLFSLENQNLACNYQWNKATFSWDDNLILSDGLLWDVRDSHNLPIHKFDKLSDSGDGLFHPGGTEVIINAQVWDLRNYHLLQTVPAFEQRRILFNKNGSVIYGVKCDDLDDKSTAMSCWNFSTFDAHDYKQLTTYEMKHEIMHFAIDNRDYLLAVIEKSFHDDSRLYEWIPSNCRLYEVGKLKREDCEEDSDIDEEEEESGDSSSDGNDGSDADNSSGWETDDDDANGNPSSLENSDIEFSVADSDEESDGIESDILMGDNEFY